MLDSARLRIIERAGTSAVGIIMSVALAGAASYWPWRVAPPNRIHWVQLHRGLLAQPLVVVLLQAYIGQFLAFLMPTQEVAIVMGLLLNNILYIFTGFTPPYATIPAGYEWLVRVNPMRYAIAIAAGLVFSDCSTAPEYDADIGVFVNVGSELGCQLLRNAPVDVGNTTVKTYVEVVFEMKHDEIALNFGIMIAFIVFFRLLGMVVLRFVNHQTK